MVCIGLSGPAIAGTCDWVETPKTDLNPVLIDGAICSDPPNTVCRWSFEYRAQRAEDMFKEMAEKLTECLGRPKPQGSPVNHPDSYTLMQFQNREAVISLSLKDKASLQQTFLFLRVDNSTD